MPSMTSLTGVNVKMQSPAADTESCKPGFDLSAHSEDMSSAGSTGEQLFRSGDVYQRRERRLRDTL